MKILFHLHAYPKEVFAGAEMMAHRIAKFLKSNGHDIKVLSGTAINDFQEFEGIEVIKFEHGKDKDYWIWSDLVVTHLGNTNYCYNMQTIYRKKLVHIIHNSFEVQLTRAKVKNNYIVYNSEFSRSVLRYPSEGIVCIPPVDYRSYAKVDNSKGKYFTLVNLNENKGGQLLIDVAKALPDIKFLGVEGGYYEQIKEEVPNLKYWKPQNDMKKVYEVSKCIMILSEYESWGQVATEAISSGVPVISTKAKGVKAALDYAATYCDRSVEGVVEAIKKLTDTKYYKEQKELTRQRAIELDPIPYLNTLNEFLLRIHKKHYLN
jgi:glycosyltransferase involved in cell wall biosynthesis